MIVGSPKQLGEALLNRRRELGLTQDQIAWVIGVNRRVVGEIERGKSTARLEIVLNMAVALGLSIDLRPRER